MSFEASAESLKSFIRDVPDFPKPGIVFKDITTLLKDPVAFRRSLDLFTVLCGDRPVDAVMAIESRGFILGSALADRLGVGFVPVRKPGKLPARTIQCTNDLEYGTDCLEVHEDAFRKGERVHHHDQHHERGQSELQERRHSKVVRPARLERATCGLGIRCSIQLSYEREGNPVFQGPRITYAPRRLLRAVSNG